MSPYENMRQEPQKPWTLSLTKRLFVAGLVAIGYYAAARLSYAYSFQPSNVAVVWVPAGFMLALLLLLSRREWPFAVPGAFVGNALADMTVGISPAIALAGATANCIESVVAAWLVLRLLGSPIHLRSLKQVLGLILGAAVLSNAVTALIGAAVLSRGAGMGQGWFVWWIGDGIGMLIAAPVILTWAGMMKTRPRPRWQAGVEAGILFVMMAVVANFVLGSRPEAGIFPNPNPYMTFPFLFWAALRFGPPGAAAATLVISAVTAWHAAHGVGFFAASGASPMNHILEAYAYLSFASLSSLIPAAILSERRMAENKLRESEERYRLVAETATDAIITINQSSVILFANPATERLFGYPAGELLGREITLLMPDYLRHLHKAAMKRYIETGERHISWENASLTGLHRSGREFPIEVSFGELVKDGEHLFTGIVRDVTEKQKAEEALRLSEERYRQLFESNPHPMWIFNRETLAFLAVNDAAVHQYGFTREEFLAMTIEDIRPPEEMPKLLADLEAGHTGHDAAGSWKHRKKDGTVFEVEVASHELSWMGRPAKLVLALDVTERQRLQEQLLQSQKMEAVGHLAGGIAHDFNNLLGVILGYSEIALIKLPHNDPLHGKIEEIKKAAERAAGLTRQLLAFSRKQVIEPRVFGLNSVVADLSRMLQRTIREDISLVTVLADGLGRVRADPSQIEQVIMNLVVNARDAMPSGGKLIIETANVALDEAYARDHFPVVPGRYVMLAVSDTGVGMDARTQRRIFEPFFTTKEKEKGTGLGLSTAYGIVKQSGGYIWVYSEPNKGTTFKVYLPRVEAPEEAAPKAEVVKAIEGTETILLVEDAEGLRELANECLQSKGYTVLAAKDGTEALNLAQQHGGHIHLLVTDVVLPGIDGRELAEQLVLLHPETRVLYVSGYTDNAIVHHGVLEPGIAFLQKPFALNDLWCKVRDVLDAGREQ